ncbi:MAG: sugar transferase [Acidimicrobiia bacterium]|nr:sugar transferase [Acidimicrobiia bacterium]
MSAPPMPLRAPESEGAHLSFVVPPRGIYVRLGKPALDRAVAAMLLVALSPILLVVGLLVRMRIGSPVLFRQRRVGRDGEPFDVVKFRTMAPDRRMGDRRASRRLRTNDRRRTHKSEEDPRHTHLGRQLRKWSLDELPQLWNVVCGEMSLVGPRPELIGIVDRYEGWQRQRHLVKPGMTGLWQISRRGEGMMHLYTDIDLEYVATIGLRTDLRILLRTLPAALARSGS